MFRKGFNRRTKVLRVSETEKEQSLVQTFRRVPLGLCFFSWGEVCFSSLQDTPLFLMMKCVPHWLPDTHGPVLALLRAPLGNKSWGKPTRAPQM